ncbi:ABC transporter permease [Mammaliicoccus lentus]|uniref:ABC transporter permease n=1 Tax=Mammaliicoccus lentus TaxID=42858 RepID=UPI00374E85F5
MKELKNIFNEQSHYFTHIFKLSFYSMKNEYANHYLGMFWNVIQPIFQLTIYFIVFGLGLRAGGDRLVDGAPFIIHLITGLFPWLFLSQSINSGAAAINKNIGILSKMKFPSSVFLSISLTNNIFNLFITTIIVFTISLINNYVPWWHYFYFIYFLFSAIILIYGISLITSTLVIIIKDTKNLLQNIVRMFFFITPIFWAIDESNNVLKNIAGLNPFSYLIEIYRLSFIHETISPILSWHNHLYFWSLTLLILLIGSIIHHSFKDKLLDYV